MSAYKKLAKTLVAEKEEEAETTTTTTTQTTTATTTLTPAEAQKLEKMRNLYKNKQHTLVLSSRGINSRYRHLMNDLISLMPHAKKDVKFDAKTTLYELNEVADMKNCNNVIFFECKRKKQDLYVWIARSPNGPSAKFQATNVHTMNELKFSGNCLKGSRPLLYFDGAFDATPHTKLLKELFSQTFGTPNMHPKSKPFVDHMICFYLSPDGKIWFRNYQITEQYLKAKERTGKAKEEQVLIEIGPRFVLNPIKILSSSFAGAPIYENPYYVPPSAMRALDKDSKAKKYVQRVIENKDMAERKATLRVQPTLLDSVFNDDDVQVDGLVGEVYDEDQDTEFQQGDEGEDEDDDNLMEDEDEGDDDDDGGSETSGNPGMDDDDDDDGGDDDDDGDDGGDDDDDDE